MRSEANEGRVMALDVLRGAVMVLMAIDHVRVYSGVRAFSPIPAVFFTRWVTHFCAPGFVFFAGASAFLHGRKLGDTRVLARYLVTRGAWLILLELSVIRIAWTFNLDYGHYLLAGVIWMLGWCMILLAVLVQLPPAFIAAFALVVILGHNIMDSLPPALLERLSGSWIWQLLYFGGEIQLGQAGPTFVVLYSIVPWIGVMAAGYAFGRILILEPPERRRLCLRIGGGAILLFLVLRGLDMYGDPRHWRAATTVAMPALLRFLNATKYPASLLFLLMTLGPLIALLPLVESARGPVSRTLAVFGRVPLFYYLVHIPLIHAAALAVSWLREGRLDPWLFTNFPMMPPPPPAGYTWGLPLLYLVFLIVVALLYPLCRYYGTARARGGWLRYL